MTQSPPADADPTGLDRRVVAVFRAAVVRGDVSAVDRLLETEPVARANVNAPLFCFDGRAVHQAGGNVALIDVLIRHGADLNLKSAWWAGGFGVLDHADPATARALIDRGARVDIFAAANLDQIDRATELLDADPALIHAPGGDGGRPLHFAGSVRMIDLLLDRGADLEARDNDHAATAAQWAVPRPPGTLDRLARLIQRGAAVDIFMAAATDDVPRLTGLLESAPALIDARTGAAGVPLCPDAPGGHQYIYSLGRGRSPFQVATAFGARSAADFLHNRCTPGQKLVEALSIGDRTTATAALAGGSTVSGIDPAILPAAAWDGNAAAVTLMLDVGLDPAAFGDQIKGTALHAAAWHGRADIVALILSHPAVIERLPNLIGLRDASYQGTPLDCCFHGSTNAGGSGNFAGVARLLLTAGAVPGSSAATASAEVRAVLG